MTKLLGFHFCFEIDVYFINHNNISMHLKNSLEYRAHYLFHVVMVPGENIWDLRPCSSVSLRGTTDPPSSFTQGRLSHGVGHSQFTQQMKSTAEA